MKKQILSIAALFAVVSLHAQKNLISIRGERGTSNQFTTISNNINIAYNPSSLKTLLSLSPNSDLILKSTEKDNLNYVNYRFYQTYNGIPVENTMYIISTKYGVIRSLNGSIVTDFDETMQDRSHSKLSSQEAVAKAIASAGAKLFAWQDEGMEQKIKTITGDATASYAPKASLVWYNTGDEINPRELRLCYKVDVYALQPLGRADYFVDAQTGELLGKKDKLYFSDATGTASTAYSGSQTIHSDFTGTNYRLRDYTRGNGVITLHGETGSRGTDYTSTSANWALTGTNIAALDAHYGVEQTYSFYFSNFNRNSYDNLGTALYSYVNDPTYTDNAFWDGSAMNYNKRSNGAPGGVTGIDVTGHELTHGVTQTTSALNYSGEPGAINESMSDIMGKSVQFWAKPTDINWLMSNDMNWIIRDMSNPNAQGQPDTYKGTYWYTGTNQNVLVHTNSGVGNYMFYLLVNGGSGTNDIGNAYSVTGLGLSKADQIIYRSETVYLVSTSSYSAWRTACINAATDLYGAGSPEVTSVQNAFYAVGIGTAGGGGGCSTPAGLASSSITSTSATVSWGAVSGAVSYNLQYKISSSATWTTVSGITATSYNLTGLTASTVYNYQVQAVCSGSTTSAYSAASSFTTLSGGGTTYCTTSGNTTYEYINKILLGTINNTSGNNSGYGNYTALSTNLTAGTSASITMTPGFTGSSYTEYWTVYIDYNKNGVFTDAGEQVASGSGAAAVTKSFIPPVTAKNGATRMRIIMHYGSSRTTTCGTFTDGEAEDYTVNISGGTGFAANNTGSNFINLVPNPVKGTAAQAEVILVNSGNINLKVTDLSGQLMSVQNNLYASAGKHVFTINVSNMLPGTYMIIAEQAGAVVARSQFVIAR